MTITLELPHELELHLREEAARKGVSIDRLILQGIEHQVGGLPIPESLSETELLERIKLDLGIVPDVWIRYNYLNKRLQHEELTKIEHQELIALIDVFESANVERLKCLIQVAKLRGMSLEKTMADLGIYPLGDEDENE